MSIHNLPFEDQLLYLRSTVTNMQLLHRAEAYSSIELSFKQFDDIWGGPQDNQQFDELSVQVACLYYLSLYQLLISRNDVDVAERLLELKKAIETDKYINCVSWTLTDVPTMSTASTILDGNTDAANSINILLDLIKKKNLDLTVGALIRDCLNQVEQCIEHINQDNYAEYQKSLLTVMSRISISFDKKTEINRDIWSHDLFIELYAKLATAYAYSLEFEMRETDSIAGKYAVFEHLARVRQTVIEYGPATNLVDAELNQASKQLQKDIDDELERLAKMDYSNCAEGTATLVEGILQSILLAILDENSLYNESESVKKSHVFLACYNEIKRLLAANSQRIEVVDKVKNLHTLVKFIHRKTTITGIPTEELELLELRIQYEEILCSKNHRDLLSKIEIVKSKLKEKRKSLIGESSVIADDEQLKANYVSAAAELNREQQKLLSLINYYFAFYYHVMIGHYQGLNKRREREILVSKAILHYETAQSIRVAYLEELEDTAYGDLALLSTCQENYQNHLAWSIPHLMKLLKVEIAKADELFTKKDFAEAASAYMACWKFLDSHPELIVNNSVIQPKQILLNAARTYHLVKEYPQAWSCYALLLKSSDLLSLPELFEIRAFLSEYLNTQPLNTAERYSLENMHYMISQRVRGNSSQLSQVVLHGPREWQQEAYSELTTNFSKDNKLYPAFVHEVVSLYERYIRKHEELKETISIKAYLKNNFPCYGQILYDISANLNLQKLTLHKDFNSTAIANSFFQMAVERGCGPACYDYAIIKYNQDEYLDALRKFKMAILDMSWDNEEKKQDARNKIKRAQLELRRRHQANPLRLINERDRSPEHVSFYDEMQQFLKGQVPEIPQTPASPAPAALSPHLKYSVVEEPRQNYESSDDDEVSSDKGDVSFEKMDHEGSRQPKSILKTKNSGKRSYKVAFESGNNLTLFAPENAPSYDRRTKPSPQYQRQQDLLRQGKRECGDKLAKVDELSQPVLK
ncbi:hypothetical protein [Legionella fallonii]|nr:hypothetical protein [Legionella fallonii]